MSGPLLYVTGTNTGVGKTTLAALLLNRARERKIVVGAFKPFCTGSREDAEKLHALQTAGMSLGEVNPFHFDEAVTPLLAARRSGQRISLEQTLSRFPTAKSPLLVEGAGGLLSPLGEEFSLLDIVQKRPGRVCVVGSDQLGVLNHVLLTAEVLGSIELSVVLMGPAERDDSTGTNVALLKELIPRALIMQLPHLAKQSPLPEILDELLAWWLESKAI